MNRYYFDEEGMKNFNFPEQPSDKDKSLMNLREIVNRGYHIESFYDHMYTEYDAGIKFHYPEGLTDSEYGIFVELINSALRHHDEYAELKSVGTVYLSDTSAEDIFDTDVRSMPGWTLEFVGDPETSTIEHTMGSMKATYSICPMSMFFEVLSKIMPNVSDVMAIIDQVRILK